MKVCLIYDFLTEPGGLERVMANHARMLKEEGFDVEVLTYQYNKEVIKRSGFKGIPISNISIIKTKYELVNIFSSIFLSFLGVNNLKNNNPDLFVSYSFPANFLIRNKKTKKINYMNHYPHFLYLNNKEKIEWAASTKGLKRWVVTILSWFFGWYFRELDTKLVRRNNLNFANSNFTKKRLDQTYNIKCVVSYPPISEIFKPSKKKLTDKYVFAAGRIIPDKKYEWLIKACAHMKNKIPLFISGDCKLDYLEKLKKLAKEKKVEVKFVSKSLKDLIIYYTNASVFAFPTPKEDFGLVPAESLTCGTPAVVWGDGAGPTEQVIDGVNGFYAKSYNTKDFAKKMDLVIDNKIKQKNRKKIFESAKKFSFNEIKKDFIKEINKVLQK